MLISNTRITESIVEAIDRLLQRSDIPPDARYDLTVAGTALRHLQHVDAGAGEEMHRYTQQLMSMLQPIESDATLPAPAREIATQLAGQAAVCLASASTGARLKDEFIALLNAMESAFGRLARISPELTRPLLATMAEPLLRQHASVSMFDAPSTTSVEEAAPGDPLTVENLGAYLRERLADPTAMASNITTLTGGFGKETTLFSVTSKTLTADLVMRRDTPIEVFGDLDCHIAAREFPLLKAMHARGVPVPEPIWCETAPRIIAGPAYSIVRRVPGAVIGDATGGSGRISVALQGTLARTLAMIHGQPPLDELDHIPAFRPALRAMKSGECTRTHIAALYALYIDSVRVPTPVLHGLFNWLLTHVPEAEEPTTLVHGDFGFHNLLFHEGELSAVLDWEFSHIGDPAEDIAYVRNMMGPQMDWPLFLAQYRDAGRPVPDARRILFYEIWSHVRNAATTVIHGAPFESGRLRHLKYGMMFYRFIPHFIAQAERLINDYTCGRYGHPPSS